MLKKKKTTSTVNNVVFHLCSPTQVLLLKTQLLQSQKELDAAQPLMSQTSQRNPLKVFKYSSDQGICQHS